MPGRSLEEQARQLFAPLGPTYDRVGAALSLGQDPLWRRFLVSRLPRGGHVLDVATGTGLVATELLRQGFEVTGVDQSPEMLAVAHRRFGDDVKLINASAEALPLGSESFDHLTFTYLLRYVTDPAATLAELARVASSPRSSSASRRAPLARSGTFTSKRCCRSPAASSGTAGARSANSSEGRSVTSGSATRSSASSNGGTPQASTGWR